jgi:hypothetical protein
MIRFTLKIKSPEVWAARPFVLSQPRPVQDFRLVQKDFRLIANSRAPLKTGDGGSEVTADKGDLNDQDSCRRQSDP